MGFRQMGNFTPPTPQNEALKIPPRLGLTTSKHEILSQQIRTQKFPGRSDKEAPL